jgi:methionyl-tRNA synthetase
VENRQRVHALGKGVIRFHAIYWPAMLLSAGLPLPTTEFVHGYIHSAGAKMSKSLGNVVDPEDLVERYGTDAVRYYLLRAVTPTGDANFTTEQFEARYNADLSNDLGNLLNRTVSMIGRYRGGVIPAPGEATELEDEVRGLAERLPERVAESMHAYNPQVALDAVWELVTRINKYVEESAPWALMKAARGGESAANSRLDTALYTLAESVRVVATLLESFLPETAQRMLDQLGMADGGTEDWPSRLGWGRTAPGTVTGKAQPLFPRLETQAAAS